MVSGTISKILSSQFAESSGEIKFPQIQGIVLEKVIQYLYYKVRHTNSARNPPNFLIEPGIYSYPLLIHSFIYLLVHIILELSLELLLAANYLDV